MLLLLFVLFCLVLSQKEGERMRRILDISGGNTGVLKLFGLKAQQEALASK